GFGGGRFVLYTAVGTRNPPFSLNIKVGDRFPAYSLPDQMGVTHTGPVTKPGVNTLIVVYRGDFCPFARFELSELTKNLGELTRAGLDVVAISADPVDRSQMLAKFLRTPIPLLSDEHETLLGPLGLVHKHRNGEPDDAIPAFFILDQTGVVRWIFTSPYYREMPTITTILEASGKISSAESERTTSPR
ncbi:MAG TPA: peroxiredoxin family protein, partial [Candidatus Binataceae bacterium]|nr:peroxiredoxin family protein [Candidatus Binataceae bacterium]